MTNLLSLIKDVLYYVVFLVKKIDIHLKKKEIGEAFEKSENTQEPIEKVISDNSGRPSKYKYDGMLTREDKERGRSLVDKPIGDDSLSENKKG